MNDDIEENTIQFGIYKNKPITCLLKDRQYCRWLLTQDFFKTYQYQYKIVSDYDPLKFFIDDSLSINECLKSYRFFKLIVPNLLSIKLSAIETKCYQYYYDIIDAIKTQAVKNFENDEDKIFDKVKTPTKYLKIFEEKYKLNKKNFLDFIVSHDLPNVTKVIEEIKLLDNILYKGNKSFIIAKQKSVEQEDKWFKILNAKYGDKISSQYKYKKCIFDFINITSNTIYECKLNIKDFKQEQFDKYNCVLKDFDIVYLFNTDCIVVMKDMKIYTTCLEKYLFYQMNIPLSKKVSNFDKNIKDFEIVEMNEDDMVKIL